MQHEINKFFPITFPAFTVLLNFLGDGECFYTIDCIVTTRLFVCSCVFAGDNEQHYVCHHLQLWKMAGWSVTWPFCQDSLSDTHSVLAPICCTAYNSRDICEKYPKQWSVTGWTPTLTASVIGVYWPAPFYVCYYQMFDVDRQPLLSFPVKLAQQFAKSRPHCCTCFLEITSASFMSTVPVMVHGFMLCVQRDQTTAFTSSRLPCTLGQ